MKGLNATESFESTIHELPYSFGGFGQDMPYRWALSRRILVGVAFPSFQKKYRSQVINNSLVNV